MVRTCPVKEIGTKSYRCFFELALQVIGGKWKPIILYHLALRGPTRFMDLKRGMPEISERMLSRQLKELEEDEVIRRQAFPEAPPRVEYALSPLGRRLLPSLLELRKWGIEYERHLGGGVLPFDPEEYEGTGDPLFFNYSEDNGE